ncbi:DUF7576 family protein [Halegenticoccus soli]|uniref:DUF7576 family protein n=1 Tax=Halegenticoccus soli TaxID=1985678 RepID=UPI000C6EC6F6|nr:hypothetical protein [Halegenticoccus soli]
MALSDYAGRTPRGYDGDTTIGRVARHHRWGIGGETRGDCVNCGTELRLHERHLLVTLVTGASGETDPGDRHHLCDERCLREWLGESEPG